MLPGNSDRSAHAQSHETPARFKGGNRDDFAAKYLLPAVDLLVLSGWLANSSHTCPVSVPLSAAPPLQPVLLQSAPALLAFVVQSAASRPLALVSGEGT